jgi:hypothetical protein
VIQQVPLTPETLTRFYVISAAGQPVPLSNLVTLKTPIGGGKAVIGSNVKVAVLALHSTCRSGTRTIPGHSRISTRSRSQ